MSQDVDRQQVFQTTKVRTSLKNDLSWIQKSKAREESSSPSKDTPLSPKRLSYVMMTAKKFESTENPTKEEPTPFAEPTTLTDNGLQNGNNEKHTSPEQSTDQQATATATIEVKNDLEASKSNEEAAADVKDVSATSTEIVTGQNNDVGDVTAEPKVNGSPSDTKTGGEAAIQPEIVTCEEAVKIVETSVGAPVENETIILTKEEAVQGSVVPDILAESVYKSPSVLESQPKENGCSNAKALDILYDSLVQPIKNIDSKEANSGLSSLVDQSATEDAIIVSVLKVETTDEDTDAANDVEPANPQTGEEEVKAPAEEANSASEISATSQDVGKTESQSTEQKEPTKEDTVEVEITKTEEKVVQNCVAQNVEKAAQDTTEVAPSQIKEEVSVDETATEEVKTSTTEATKPEIHTETKSSESAKVETVVASSEIKKAETIEVQASEPVVNLVTKTEEVTTETVEEKTVVEPTHAEVKSEATSEQVPNAVPETSEQPIEKVEVSNETEVQGSVATPAAAIEETKSTEIVVESTVETSAQPTHVLPVLTETKPDEKVEVISCELSPATETTVKVDSPEIKPVEETKDIKEAVEEKVEVVVGTSSEIPAPEIAAKEVSPEAPSQNPEVTMETTSEKVEAVVVSSSEIPPAIVTTQETEVKENITEAPIVNDAKEVPAIPEPVVETKDEEVKEKAVKKVEAKAVVSSSEMPPTTVTTQETKVKENITEAASENNAKAVPVPVVETKHEVATEKAAEKVEAKAVVSSSEAPSVNSAPAISEPEVKSNDAVVTETTAEKVEAEIVVGTSSEIPAPEIAAKEVSPEAPSQNPKVTMETTSEKVEAVVVSSSEIPPAIVATQETEVKENITEAPIVNDAKEVPAIPEPVVETKDEEVKEKAVKKVDTKIPITVVSTQDTEVKENITEVPSQNDAPEVPAIPEPAVETTVVTEAAAEKIESKVVVGASSEIPAPEIELKGAIKEAPSENDAKEVPAIPEPVVETKDEVVKEKAVEKVEAKAVVSSSEMPPTTVTTQETKVKEKITEAPIVNDAKEVPAIPEPVVETKHEVVTERAAEKVEAKAVVSSSEAPSVNSAPAISEPVVKSNDAVVTETTAEKVEAEIVVSTLSEIPEPEIVSKEEAPSQNEAAPEEETEDTEVTEEVVETVQAKSMVESAPVIPAEASVNEASFEIEDALELAPKDDSEQTKADKEATIEPTQKPETTTNSSTTTEEKEEETCGSFIMRDGKEVCSHCDQFIGNIKITVNYPAMYLHPDCLKCGTCTKILGDFLYPMFQHNKIIYCSECYDNVYSV